jgi:AhpD family alkylhydroperoxidase
LYTDVGPDSIAAATNESIMLAVNGVNECPYCTGLHGELGRMAGADEVATTADATTKACVEYARIFAANDGRGDVVDTAKGALVKSVGEATAARTDSLCWYVIITLSTHIFCAVYAFKHLLFLFSC